MKFYTSDLHFNHANIMTLCHRPFKSIEEMNETIILKWNQKILASDEVYILGDVVWGNGLMANQFISRLKGKKFLIEGNHDYRFLKDRNFDLSLFKWVKKYEEIEDNYNKVILCHYPMAEWNGFYHNSIDLFGHVHDNPSFYHNYPWAYCKNAYNVGVDVNDFEPKTLTELTHNARKIVTE